MYPLHDSLELVCYNIIKSKAQETALTAFAHALHDCKRIPDEDTAAREADTLLKEATAKS